MGVSPSQQAAMSTTGSTSATEFQNIISQGVRARSQGATLDTMLGDVGQFVPGTGADATKSFKQTLTSWAPPVANYFGVSPESVAANESFDKFANQLADAQGAGSDARMAVNQAANPSSHLTQAGVDLIIRQLRGNADYLIARSQLASQYPDKSDRIGFENGPASNLDPRVFQFARMTPEQKTTFYNNMADKGTFQKNYNFAKQNGLVQNAGQ
jgi:hypothetical protein